MTLIRSGINKIRVIDYDIITLSSLNRHAFATRKDVGKLKVKVVEEFTKEINPNIIYECIDDAFMIDDADEYIKNGNPDYVIDCIDDLNSKCDLLKTTNSELSVCCSKPDPLRYHFTQIF